MKIEDTVAEQIETVGDLYNAICDLTLDWDSVPVGVETLGQLITRAAPLNAQVIIESGTRLPDRWTMLTRLAAEDGMVSPADIYPDTFLHLESLKLCSRSV